MPTGHSRQWAKTEVRALIKTSVGLWLASAALSAAAESISPPSIPAETWPIRLAAERNSIVMGEPLELTLYLPPQEMVQDLAIEQFDAEIFAPYFHIARRSRGQDSQGVHWDLQLYPRQPGTATLDLPPPWTHDPLTVEVKTSSARIPEVRFKIQAPNGSGWVQERLEITLEACTNGYLLWQKPLLPKLPGVRFTWLRETQAERRTPAGRCSATRWTGAFSAAVPGTHHIDFGWIQASSFGQLLQWPTPTLTLEIRDIPQWLPAGLPHQAPRWRWLSPPQQVVAEQLSVWRAQLLADYPPALLQTLLQSQLAAAGFSDEPISLRAEPRPDGRTRFVIELYARPSPTRTPASPRLHLPWAARGSTQLRQVTVDWPPYTVTVPAAAPQTQPIDWLGWLYQALASITLGALAGFLLRPWWRIGHGIYRIARARDAQDLQNRLLQLARQRRITASSLGQLGHLCARDLPGLTAWALRFEACRFAPGNAGRIPLSRHKRALLQTPGWLRWLWRRN